MERESTAPPDVNAARRVTVRPVRHGSRALVWSAFGPVTAEDGEILVSSALEEAAVGMDVGFADRGVHLLKGVPGEWHLYRLDAVALSGA